MFCLCALVLHHPAYSENITSDYCQQHLKKLALNKWDYVRDKRDSERCSLQADVLTWFALYQADKSVTFLEYITFVKNHPTWPWLQKIRKHAEKVADQAPASAVLSWFNDYSPQTIVGVKAYIKALASLPLAKRTIILKKIWATLPLSPDLEKDLYKTLKPSLTIMELASRAHYYLDLNEPTRAKAIVKLLPPAYQKIAHTRIQLQTGTPIKTVLPVDARILLDALVYYRQQNDDVNTVKANTLLKNYKTKLYALNADKTWRQVHILVRRAFERGEYAQALDLITGHQGLKEGNHADALWLTGWLQATVQKNLTAAISSFKLMYNHVKNPISLSKAAFWVGQTYEYKGDKNQATLWFEKAAAFPTTFYGQEAFIKLNKPFVLPKDKAPLLSDIKAFRENNLIQAAVALLDTPFAAEFKTFLYMAIKHAKTQGECLLILDLAQKHAPYEVVVLAKSATHLQEINGDHSFPLLPPSLQLAVKKENIDLALAHAVIRKESAFNPTLVSPAGAQGLMQLMPATAKMVAKQKSMPYSFKGLTDNLPYNIHLGCAYLKENLDTYQGALPLTLAAYNAGPKNAEKWLRLFGDPRTSHANLLTWIEIIPFGETRNYIQRVIEAVRVYQYRLTLLKDHK